MEKLAFLLRIRKAHISDRNRMFCLKLLGETLLLRLVMCLRTEQGDTSSSFKFLSPTNAPLYYTIKC